MEKDPEMKGDGNSYTTEFRQYDPRLGRWLSLDPLMMQFPDMSPYVAFNNNPIYFTDPFGLEGDPVKTGLGAPGAQTEDAEGNCIDWKNGDLYKNLETGKTREYTDGYWSQILNEVVVIGKIGQVAPVPGNDPINISLVLTKALEFKLANISGETYQSPSTTYSIKKIKDGTGGIDCSGLISQIFIQSGFKDPRKEKGNPAAGTPVGHKGKATNGVSEIIDGLPIIDLNNLKRGDLVTFKTDRSPHQGKDGCFDHIGIVTSVTIVDNVVVSFEYYDSGGTNSNHKKKKKKDPNTTYKAGPRKSKWSGDEKGKIFKGAYRPAYVIQKTTT